MPLDGADVVVLRLAVAAVAEQIDRFRELAAGYAHSAGQVRGDPVGWATLRGQAMAYEVAALRMAEALSRAYQGKAQRGG